jgi:hypothetical protein
MSGPKGTFWEAVAGNRVPSIRGRARGKSVECGNGSGSAAGSGSGSGSSSSGKLTSGSTNLLGRTPTALAGFVGRPAAGRAVKVVSVVGDEVFWVGSSSADRVLVHLRTSGESPPKVRAGDHATFTGTLAKNAAGTYGVTEREGAALLKRQGVHVETSVSTLKLTH